MWWSWIRVGLTVGVSIAVRGKCVSVGVFEIRSKGALMLDWVSEINTCTWLCKVNILMKRYAGTSNAYHGKFTHQLQVLSFTPQFILGAAGTSEPKGASLGTASLIVGRFSSLFPARFVLKHARVLYANDLPHHPAQKVPVWAMARDKLQKPMFLMALDFS